MPAIEWFAYCFPNRRSDRPVVEVMLDFKPADRFGAPQNISEIKNVLISGGVLTADEIFPEEALPDDLMGSYTSLLVQLALLFQRKAGHRVSFYSVICYPDQNRSIGLLEHEHCDVGMTAVKLAAEVIQGKRKLLTGPFQTFAQFAHERLLPIDTEVIINAAGRRNIPVVQLERQPYTRQQFEQLTGGDCIRRNGLLMLGYGEQQHVVDGTFCLDLSPNFKEVRSEKSKRVILLENLGIACISPDENNQEGLEKFHLIAVNGEVTAVVNQNGTKLPAPDSLSDSTAGLVRKLNRELGFAPIMVTVMTNDVSLSLQELGGGVVDFELAPELDRYLDKNDIRQLNLLNSTADKIIDWLFGNEEYTRIPIIAITGTNGKTTTTRMINHVLMSVGRKPGMVCTDGAYLNGQQISMSDECTDTGHLKVLTSKEVDVAVLETHHAGIMLRGFAFGWCDIAICLNVSEDHQGKYNVDTLDDMATLKQALPERARQAVLLHADDPRCLAMLGSLVAKDICLVSIESDITELRALGGKAVSYFCVVEKVESDQWLVIYKQSHRIPVMKVSSIPATFDGTARFNVSNAMHAILTCYLLGISVKEIKTAMSGFSSCPENTPGRLNVFDDLPFRIIMDFAHNPDGMRKLCEFVDQQCTTGRKVLAFAGTTTRKDEIIRNMGRSVAGHFDFYFCKEHESIKDENPRPVAHLLKQGLLESGVSERHIATKSFGKDVVFEIFSACQKGDLLVMLMGHIEKKQLAGYIEEYARLSA